MSEKELLQRCLDLLNSGEKDCEYDEYGPHYLWKIENRNEVYNLINDIAKYLEDEYDIEI